jgi:hypothetical protein
MIVGGFAVMVCNENWFETQSLVESRPERHPLLAMMDSRPLLAMVHSIAGIQLRPVFMRRRMVIGTHHSWWLLLQALFMIASVLEPRAQLLR